jgi:hypothetical protein
LQAKNHLSVVYYVSDLVEAWAALLAGVFTSLHINRHAHQMFAKNRRTAA